MRLGSAVVVACTICDAVGLQDVFRAAGAAVRGVCVPSATAGHDTHSLRRTSARSTLRLASCWCARSLWAIGARLRVTRGFLLAGNAVRDISTTGLRWNLQGHKLAMDGLVRFLLRVHVHACVYVVAACACVYCPAKPAVWDRQVSSSNLLSSAGGGHVTVTTSDAVLWSVELQAAAWAPASKL